MTEISLEEIKKKLDIFLLKSKNNQWELEMDSMMDTINPTKIHQSFKKMYYDYSFLNMKDEIVDVLDSLIRICGKEVEYNEQKNLDMIYRSTQGILNCLS